MSRHALALAAALAASTLLSPPALALAGGPVAQGVVRLHIVANSNLPDDIAAKVAVRQALLAYLAGRVAGARTQQEAMDRVAALAPGMTRIANETLRGYGLTYRAQVELGSARLPSRTYLAQSLPAGRYVTLEVVLGAGRGQNWWCLLFPDLCQTDPGASVAGSESRAAPPSGFLALGRTPPPSPLAVKPGGLLWRFWRLWRADEVGHAAPR